MTDIDEAPKTVATLHDKLLELAEELKVASANGYNLDYQLLTEMKNKSQELIEQTNKVSQHIPVYVATVHLAVLADDSNDASEVISGLLEAGFSEGLLVDWRYRHNEKGNWEHPRSATMKTDGNGYSIETSAFDGMDYYRTDLSEENA